MRRKSVAFLIVAMVAAPAMAALFGPGKFKVVEADTRFTESGNPVFRSENNRISRKSVVGGIHLNADGVYVNPIATRSKASGEVLAIGLTVLNKTDFDTMYGGPNQLGVLREIAFLLDDSIPLVLPIENGRVDWADTSTYNSITRSASAQVAETGIARISIEQYRRVLSAKSIAVRIEGSKRSVTYEVKDIAPTFRENLQAFYESALK
ncbi:MAG: hypothetical protein R3F58_07880 [Steroidobacteraceae bacterium]